MHYTSVMRVSRRLTLCEKVITEGSSPPGRRLLFIENGKVEISRTSLRYYLSESSGDPPGELDRQARSPLIRRNSSPDPSVEIPSCTASMARPGEHLSLNEVS